MSISYNHVFHNVARVVIGQPKTFGNYRPGRSLVNIEVTLYAADGHSLQIDLFSEDGGSIEVKTEEPK